MERQRMTATEKAALLACLRSPERRAQMTPGEMAKMLGYWRSRELSLQDFRDSDYSPACVIFLHDSCMRFPMGHAAFARYA